MTCIEISRCGKVSPGTISITLNSVGDITYSDITINGKKLNELTSTKPSDLCVYLKSIELIRKDRKWKSKAQQGDTDSLDMLEKKICKSLKEVQTTQRTKTKTEPKEIRGCIEPEAANYYCKRNPSGCVDGELPKGIVSTQCSYEKVVTIEHNYLFCDSKNGDCTSNNTDYKNRILKGKHTIKTNMKEVIEPTYVNMLKVVNSMVPSIETGYIKIVGNSVKGFYGTISEEDKKDFANALTVAVINNYDDDKGEFIPGKVTIKGGEAKAQERGNFNIIKGDNMVFAIDKLNPTESRRTFTNRVVDIIGTDYTIKTDLGLVKSLLKKNVPNMYVTDEGRFSVKESTIGLGSLLHEEPEGLGRLLK